MKLLRGRTAAIAAMLVLAAGCGKMPFMGGADRTVALENSGKSPAARGEVAVQTDDNQNSQIDVSVEHMAPPENLTPPSANYYVWAQTPDGRTDMIGQLALDEDQSASLRAMTPLQKFRILITAEDQPLPQQPSENVILSSNTVTTAPGR